MLQPPFEKYQTPTSTPGLKALKGVRKQPSTGCGILPYSKTLPTCPEPREGAAALTGNSSLGEIHCINLLSAQTSKKHPKL